MTIAQPEYLKAEVRRLLKTLPTVNPASYDYCQLLSNLEMVLGSSDLIGLALSESGYDVPAEDQPGVLTDKAPEPEPEPEPVPEPEPATEPEPETETPSYSMVEVRTALGEARRRGVNIAELVRSFGVNNFTAIPAGSYPELMRKLEELEATA